MRSERSTKRHNPHILAIAVLVLVFVLTLPGCKTISELTRPPVRVAAEQTQLPAVPDDIRSCFAGVVDLPAGAWSPEVAGAVLADIRASEAAKTKCGKRFILWYEDVRKGRSPPA